ncbi:4-(cytidine 5'-diphospho)-2-C-methyl-D-erythritol kinase [Ornithinimicrobium sp. F0845]|uniref:4-(cytidine 5'-diphospho)-2-C-methyl-D-erythritol kinase n=1 Tax=Ornithinimicrobium sp. F0845 TaxID=2926412 RepID=UPI001FF33FA7|nr:4-(cytidine 5'-diphospho)-2-C-methyl-D-erythritol kinase [Ornithinimicrobium sp. F0845]MCK0113893.1 4-(cytidine 5'-diphospho)-2-C-methyl-D-erythritol kinase [Ornithinimicrobium sp. F0845]
MSQAVESRGVTVRVPGKINLELVVGPLREDGFHELATVFHTVGIYDHVTATPAATWSVQVSGQTAEGVPTGADNLALKAAKSLARRYGVEEAAALSIDKNIPVAGGMAGGSADAAAALVACEALWELQVSRDELEPLAARLGSDVPFLLHGGTAIGSGRGERLAPVLARGELHWVLWVSTGSGLSTPEVYAECDRLREAAGEPVPDPAPSGELIAALRTMDTSAVGAALRNDLQEAACSLYPVLEDVLEAGTSLGAQGAIVSGSGPTVAFLVGTQAQAIDLSVGLAARGPAGDIRRATGPVAGAQVVQSVAPAGPPTFTG